MSRWFLAAFAMLAVACGSSSTSPSSTVSVPFSSTDLTVGTGTTAASVLFALALLALSASASLAAEEPLFSPKRLSVAAGANIGFTVTLSNTGTGTTAIWCGNSTTAASGVTGQATITTARTVYGLGAVWSEAAAGGGPFPFYVRRKMTGGLILPRGGM